MDSMVADIGDVDESVLGQLLLDAEEVVLNVAVGPVLGNVGDVVSRRVEGGDKTRREALVGRRIAGLDRGADRDNLRR